MSRWKESLGVGFGIILVCSWLTGGAVVIRLGLQRHPQLVGLLLPAIVILWIAGFVVVVKVAAWLWAHTMVLFRGIGHKFAAIGNRAELSTLQTTADTLTRVRGLSFGEWLLRRYPRSGRVDLSCQYDSD